MATAADRIDRVPVVIAGAGPAGLVAAVTLARNGIGSLLVERNLRLSPLPRATAVSTRTMELLRSFGLEAAVRAGQLEIASADGLATGTLASPEGVAVPLGFPDLELVAAASPTTIAAVPQDHLEPVLLDHLRAFPAAEVRFGTELVALGQDGDGVTVVLRERATGEERTVRAAYLVGADGAHSRVRAELGIAMDGPDHLAEQMTVLFEAPLAGVVGDRRHGIYIIQHPDAGGVLVPNGGDRWLYGRAWEPWRERLEDYTDGRLTGLIRAAAGVPDLPVRVVAKGAFSFAAQVARCYRSGRAFLVGDAAQRMTPRGGMGMNTAVAEGHDLAWKLAWALRGWAGPELLDSYEAEWRPVGARRAARSVAAGLEPVGAGALAEDLNGRLAHAWMPLREGRTSTLDLLGQGLTLLTGPAGRAWAEAAAGVGAPFPLTVGTLDRAAARVVGIGPDGAVLVRPDARVVACWPGGTGDPRAALAAAVAGRWFERQVELDPWAAGLDLQAEGVVEGGAVGGGLGHRPAAAAGLPFGQGHPKQRRADAAPPSLPGHLQVVEEGGLAGVEGRGQPDGPVALDRHPVLQGGIRGAAGVEPPDRRRLPPLEPLDGRGDHLVGAAGPSRACTTR